MSHLSIALRTVNVTCNELRTVVVHRACLLRAFCLCLAAVVGWPAVAQGQRFTAERAEDWEALFDRQTGWTGGDGIYSIPLDGNEHGGWPEPQGLVSYSDTLFVFSDTFIGKVGPDGKRAPGTTIVNNTLALLGGMLPNANRLSFYWPSEPGRPPETVFTPNTPSSEPDNWYWLMDGVAISSKLYIFALRMEPAGGAFPFAVAGVARIKADLAVTGTDMALIRATHTQVDAPLFAPASGPLGDIIFGSAIMVNTESARSPTPDGFIYIYGTRNDFLDKKLLAARVRPAEFEDFTAWRFWDGSQWVASLVQASPLPGVGRISSEQSVSPLPDGTFVVVSQQDGIGPNVWVHIGASPVGPFGAPIVVWECPEAKQDPDIFCYNAKAHPHLSPPGQLLITYSVNTFDFGDLFNDADIYRPRFIRLTLGRAQQ